MTDRWDVWIVDVSVDFLITLLLVTAFISFSNLDPEHDWKYLQMLQEKVFPAMHGPIETGHLAENFLKRPE